MTNDDTILREVDQALAEDKTSQALRKNLPAIIGAAVMVVIGVGGWQLWTQQRAAAAAKASIAYDDALKLGGDDKAIAALEGIAAEGGGYAALAAMRLAGERAAKGEREEALALYRDVYSGGAGTKRLKDMARIKAGYLALADGRDAVLKDVGALETDATAIGYYAREIIALAALNAGDFQNAEQLFRKAASSADAPETIRMRAEEFAALAGAGKAGVKFPTIEESKKSDVERMMDQLEKAGSDLSSVVGSGGEAEPGDAQPATDKNPAQTPPSAAPEGNE
ncbi:MAG: tetratricopeptide repeat protein [Parvularculaceae bacterium]|nr:tetratricopeptide repeat protein [Parvularculaceae bacterium]